MNKKLQLICAALVAIAFNVPVIAQHEGRDMQKMKVQSKCPIMGGKVNKKLYVDYDGKRIYVCCKGCIGKIKKDPEAALKKIKANGERPAVLQTKCPVMDKKIDKSLFADVDGKRIYVCCKGCIGKIKKAPAKFLKKLADAGQAPYDVPKK